MSQPSQPNHSQIDPPASPPGEMGLAQEIWGRYIHAPGVIPQSDMLGLARRISQFSATHISLAREIQQRWVASEGAAMPGSVLPYVQRSALDQLSGTVEARPALWTATPILAASVPGVALANSALEPQSQPTGPTEPAPPAPQLSTASSTENVAEDLGSGILRRQLDSPAGLLVQRTLAPLTASPSHQRHAVSIPSNETMATGVPNSRSGNLGFNILQRQLSGPAGPAIQQRMTSIPPVSFAQESSAKLGGELLAVPPQGEAGPTPIALFAETSPRPALTPSPAPHQPGGLTLASTVTISPPLGYEPSPVSPEFEAGRGPTVEQVNSDQPLTEAPPPILPLVQAMTSPNELTQPLQAYSFNGPPISSHPVEIHHPILPLVTTAPTSQPNLQRAPEQIAETGPVEIAPNPTPAPGAAPGSTTGNQPEINPDELLEVIWPRLMRRLAIEGERRGWQPWA